MILRRNNVLHSLLAGLLLAAGTAAPAAAQTSTTFTYQGELQNGGVKAEGTYDLRFRLYDGATGTGQVGPVVCVPGASVSGGRFTAPVDFGTTFGGTATPFIEIDVRPSTGLACDDATGFVTLTPRQAVTYAPRAMYATIAQTASNAATLNGQGPSYFQNAANLASGTIPAARLPASVPQVAANNAFTGANTFSGANTFNAVNTFTNNNVFSGANSFSGNNRFSGSQNTFDGHVIAGGAFIHSGTGDGYAMSIGVPTLASGITQEVGRQVLNLDMNFRGSVNQSVQGSAVRLDARAGQPPIQFMIRPLWEAPGVTAMWVNLDSSVGIANQLSVGSVKFPDGTTQTTASASSAPRMIWGSVSGNGARLSGSGFSASSTLAGIKITFDTPFASATSYVLTATPRAPNTNSVADAINDGSGQYVGMYGASGVSVGQQAGFAIVYAHTDEGSLSGMIPINFVVMGTP